MGWGRMDEREELNELSGRVISVIYANEENGYTVLRLDTLDGGVTTVVGTLPSACPGEELHAFGEWMTHPNHGRQFKAEYAERSLPRTTEAIYTDLAGRAVKGIGPATATLIVDRFGEKTLEVLENHPELKEVFQMVENFITDEEMARLNFLVEAEGKSPEETAALFLKEKGLIKS